MGIVRRAYDEVIPDAETLWRRTGAQMREVEIEPGRVESVPHYSIGIDSIVAHKPEIFYDHCGDRIGRHIMHTIVTSDGVDHAANVTLLDNGHRTGADFFVSDSTAWFTDVNGYAAVRDNTIAEKVGVEVIRTGADASARMMGGLDVMRLGSTVVKSRKASLAKSAEADQAMVAELAERYSLPLTQYGIGDSQAGMRKFMAQYHANQNGIPMEYMDIKALCAPDKLQVRDLKTAAQWMGTELIGGAAILAIMMLEDEAQDIMDTISLNPNFIVASIVGGTPSLAGGEAGASTAFVPSDAHGQLCHYGKDKLSRPPRWMELLRGHPNIHHKIVEKGIHAHLLRHVAHSAQTDRIMRFSEEKKAKQSVKRIDFEYVRLGDVAREKEAIVESA